MCLLSLMMGDSLSGRPAKTFLSGSFPIYNQKSHFAGILIVMKTKNLSHTITVVLGQVSNQIYLRCHPAWCINNTHSTHTHTYAEFCLRRSLLRLPYHGSVRFRSPSEVHSAKALLLRSHHPQLSVKRRFLLTHSSSTV